MKRRDRVDGTIAGDAGAPRAASVLLWCFLVLPLALAVYQGYHPPPPMGFPADFAIFRTAAGMIRSGAAAHLYNPDAQREFFFGFVGPSFSQFLVWNHPPAEALLYLPFGFMTYQTGLSLMRAINSLLLWVIALWAGYRVHRTPDALFLLGATFFLSLRPTSGTIATGQDSLWILLVLLLALFSLVGHRYAISAVLFGLASLKFTIVFPLLFILLLGGFSAVVLDAILAALLVWLVPVILFGPVVMTSYLRLCLDLPYINGRMGMYSGLLWNFRGILSYFMADPMTALGASAVAGFACALVVCRFPVRFLIPSALLVATFFSPHVYQHDALMYTGSVILFIGVSFRLAPPDTHVG